MDDSVAFRIAADYLTKHTFVDGYEGFPTVKDPGDFSALNVRGKLLVQPSSIEGLRSLITVIIRIIRARRRRRYSRPSMRCIRIFRTSRYSSRRPRASLLTRATSSIRASPWRAFFRVPTWA